MRVALLASATACVAGRAVASERPTTKVLNLLKQMLTELEKETKDDADLYQKQSCWCDTNSKNKQEAVQIAKERVQDFSSTIEEEAAKGAKLSVQLETTRKDIKDNEAALAAATELRDKEAKEFHANEVELQQSIAALKSALVVLSKHHPAPNSGLLSVSSMLKERLRGHLSILDDLGLKSAQKATLTSFLQQPAVFSSHSSQSGQVVGILEQMLEQFKKDLTAAQEEEVGKIANFLSLKAAKEEEIQAGKDQVDQKEKESANSAENKAAAQEDRKDTRAAQEADEKFLSDLAVTCDNIHRDFEERTKTRSDEMSAVQEAINIIDSPEAQEAFSGTFSKGFLQMSATTRRVHGHDTRQRVGQVLRAAALRSGSAQLAALASRAQVDVFEKVKAAIDKMVAQLKQQLSDETKQRDYCIKELDSNTRQTEDLDKHKEDLIQQKDELETAIDNLKREIEEATSELHDTLVSMKRAGEDRGEENKEFQTTVADHQATQRILGDAVSRLQEFYAKKALLQKSLLKAGSKRQEPGAAAPAQPPAHKEYRKSGSSNTVIEMINNVIHDAALLEQEANMSEQKAQEAYETFMSDANVAVGKLQREIAEKNGLRAQRDQELRDTSEAISDSLDELERLSATAADLHKSCDFFLDNFTVRQQAMADEIEALGEAKAVMSGASI